MIVKEREGDASGGKGNGNETAARGEGEGRPWPDPPLALHIFLLLSSVRRNLGNLGVLDFLPSSSFPSLFLGGLRSVLFWAVVVLLVLAPIGSSPRHLHGDRWDRASPSRFSFDLLTVRVCVGGVIGFAVVLCLCSRSGVLDP
ncbi:hypothetical protein ACOSP7_013089 [Xanthoceras sorbifolium]